MNSEQQIDLSSIKGIESKNIDLDKYHKTGSEVESVEVIIVPSEYSDTGSQWALKVSSKVLESVGTPDAKIDFRASELFNLIQDEEGKLIGFPKSDKSNLAKFLKDLRLDINSISSLQDLITQIKGKKVTIKAYEKEKTQADGSKSSRTYLKFLY